jgi:hypothetical protein
LEHGLPEGRVDKKYSQFPILQAITPDKIRITPATVQHIVSIFVKRFYDIGLDVDKLDDKKLMNELRNAIVKGYVLYNHQSDDSYNPLDRQLELYSYIDLSKLDLTYKGVAKFKILCRLSLTHGSLSIRTIQKNFPVE